MPKLDEINRQIKLWRELTKTEGWLELHKELRHKADSALKVAMRPEEPDERLRSKMAEYRTLCLAMDYPYTELARLEEQREHAINQER